MTVIDKKELEELLSCLWTDAHLALDGSWDRSDSGFKEQQLLIEKFVSKYELTIKDTCKDDEE